jgi:hypothetical protein
MKNYQHNIILTFSLAFYWVLWLLLNPVLGYMLDSDCVAYLTLAERLAKGQYFQSINGLWSPLNGWMITPFIKSGVESWAIAKAMNFFIGAIVLVLSFLLTTRFVKNKTATYLFAIVFPIVLTYQVYFQMFGDVLQLIFLLGYILLFTSPNFFKSTIKVIIASVLMGIAYYAKAYSLFFFLIHFVAIVAWAFYQRQSTLAQSVKNILIAFVTIFIVIFPWNYALHTKYKEWNFIGQSGKMNMSWNINSGKTFKPTYTLMIPPTYNDSPSFWEDPYLTQQNLSTPFSSVTHFVKWLARVVHSFVEAINCFQELTFFAFAILCFGVYYYFKTNKKPFFESDFMMQLIIMTILILPFGYLLMHIETRYIWANSILLWILAQQIMNQFKQLGKQQKLFLNILVAFSFVFFPVKNTFALRQKNKDLFETAAQLNQLKWHGKFTANVTDAGKMWVIAYLTKSSFYTIEKTNYSEQELIAEMKRYGVQYYFFEAENNIITPELHNAYLKKIHQINNLSIYQFINH